MEIYEEDRHLIEYHIYGNIVINNLLFLNYVKTKKRDISFWRHSILETLHFGDTLFSLVHKISFSVKIEKL